MADSEENFMSGMINFIFHKSNGQVKNECEGQSLKLKPSKQHKSQIATFKVECCAHAASTIGQGSRQLSN